ncbi:MAG: DUF4832 domain-containing protein, partial [Bacteroidota bacterium]
QELMVATRYYYHNKINYLENYYGLTAPTQGNNAFDGSVRSRLGTHNDAIMFEENWMWHHESISQQQAYASEDLKWVVSSGEPLPSAYALSNDPIPELSFLRFNSLALNANIEGGTGLYDYWKDAGYYDELTLELGYRFQLTTATIDDMVAQDDLLELSISLENVGFASPYNFRKSELIMRNTSDLTEQVFDLTATFDLRHLHHGAHVIDLSVAIPADMETGTYDLFLNFPNADATLKEDSRYSIQLANSGVWEGETGYNSLQHQVLIHPLALPVEWLTHPWCRVKNNSIVVNWVVGQQINNDRFEIEYASNGIDFSKVGEVKGDGTNPETKSFEFVHTNPVHGRNYYRIKQVDFDGQYSYSRLASIWFDDKITRVFPNPVQNELNIIANADQDIEIYNLLGQLLKRRKINQGSNRLSLADLPRGIYYYKMEGTSGKFQKE